MPGDTATQIGHGLAKVLGIKLQYRDPLGSSDPLTRGESTFSSGTADTYVEPEPTSAEWLYEQVPTWHGVFHYFLSLFPFLSWIGRYNLTWLAGDLVAGKFLRRRASPMWRLILTTGARYHRRRRRRPPGYGLRQAGRPSR